MHHRAHDVLTSSLAPATCCASLCLTHYKHLCCANRIMKNKERAEKESAPRELLQVDREKLGDLKTRAKGGWPGLKFRLPWD